MTPAQNWAIEDGGERWVAIADHEPGSQEHVATVALVYGGTLDEARERAELFRASSGLLHELTVIAERMEELNVDSADGVLEEGEVLQAMIETGTKARTVIAKLKGDA